MALPKMVVSQGGSLFSKTRLCHFFSAGACTRGSDCSFAHDEAELVSQPNLLKTKLCKIYASTGVCDNANCRFAHGKHEMLKLPVVRGRKGKKQQMSSKLPKPDRDGIVTHGAGHEIVQDDVGLLISVAMLNQDVPMCLRFSV